MAELDEIWKNMENVVTDRQGQTHHRPRERGGERLDMGFGER